MHKRLITLTLISLLMMLFTSVVNAQLSSLAGQVVDVLDGRTVVVQATSGRINVELQFISVPVTGDLMADIVKEHLRTLVQGKNVEYRIRNIQTDRTIGRLTVNAVDVSQQMIRDGAAWHMPVRFTGQDTGEFALYAATEAAAKNEKLGIWSVPDLKPVWERPVIETDATSAQSGPVANSSAVPKPHGYWGDKNPRLGNIGPLVNGYNARSRTGYLSTSLLGIDGKDAEFDGKLAVDVTYYYQENDGKGRNGTYLFTVACVSQEVQFLRDNDLWLLMGDKRLDLGRAERKADNDGLSKTEILRYRMSKETLAKLVNNDEAYLKIGKHLIHLTGVRYMLYNMLQLAD